MGSVADSPHKWTITYGSVALAGYDMGTHERINEKGLSVHVLFLAEVCDFGDRDPKREGIGILQWPQYYLDNFATVAEAVEAHKSIQFQIEATVLPNGAKTMLHISIEDKTGGSAVMECIGGKAEIHHDKRYIVMTNEPASIFSVMRNVSVPFGLGDPEKPNISPTCFRTVMELSGGRSYFEGTLAPSVVWIETSKFDFSKGLEEQELAVEEDILKLHGDGTSRFVKASPLVFGRHKP